MAKVVTLNPISPTTFEYQDYSIQGDNRIVNSVKARKKLTQDDRDTSYQGRINPIAT